MKPRSKLPVLVLVGPTAVGKSALSVAVARQVGAEIISGDSMQVYRGMDIGTAKILPGEMQGVPHHMIDIKEPNEAFSVAEFRERVDQLIQEIVDRCRLPLIVGGTGLYIRAVLTDYRFSPLPADYALRDRLAALESDQGGGYLHEQLQKVDPVAAARLHPNDLRRIVRALEVFETTGSPISSLQTAADAEARYDHLLVGLSIDRERLFQRIDQRVEGMLAGGWLDEVLRLSRQYSWQLPSMQAIGYRELLLYSRGHLTWSESATLIKRHTRQYAKRQLTWFRREQGINWIDLTDRLDEPARVVADLIQLCKGKWPGCAERQ